ncbi:THUMP-like domain-containing protein [Chryseobacterium sp. A301]
MDYDSLLDPEVQLFIDTHSNEDLRSLMLKKSPFEKVSMREIVVQIKGRQIAAKKYPFLRTEGIVFPEHLNLEQSSSLATAEYKSRGRKGESFLDLTLGFGIDPLFLSKDFTRRVLIERDSALIEIVKHNWKVLGREAEFKTGDLHDFLSHSNESFDLIYLDPARRDAQKKKVFLLEDLSPNLVEIQSLLLKRSKKILVKLSPLIDLTYLTEVLEKVSKIEIVAVKNEVKEVLVHMEQEFGEESVLFKCVNLESGEPDFTFTREDAECTPIYGEPKEYIYIPNNALLKSGAFSHIANVFGLEKLAKNTHLYTSTRLVKDFPGRVLRMEITDPSKLPKGSQFNIISKNHPLKPEEIKKKYKLKDGGVNYLIFTQSGKGKIVLKSI